MFSTHLRGFQGVGVHILGVYHFLYALSVEDAKAEARNCIKNVEAAGLPKNTQIWCDFEYDTIDSAAKKGVTLGADEVNSFSIAFCDTVKSAGYPTGIYTNLDYYNNYYTQSTLRKYPVWLADLKENPSKDCLLHQYSWTGMIPGYDEHLDMDYYYGEISTINEAIEDGIAESATELKVGSKGEEVKEIQKKLQKLGYVIAVDGDFGKNCEKIVKEFQAKNGLKVDGVVGINTMAKIDDLISATTKMPDLVVDGGDVKVTANVANTLSPTEIAIRWMENLAKDDSHGYDQIYRWGERGDYDCSSATITAWKTAGINLTCTYTGNMKDDMLRKGFVDVTKKVNMSTGAGLVRGDVLLNEVHHVAMYCGNGMEVEASINERGGATYGAPGDQTGREILIRPYRNYPWDCVLRFNGSSAPDLNVDPNELKIGSIGEPVKNLQQKLVVLGYSLETDGEFGAKTEAAVKDFQKKYNLKIDGVVGEKTLAKIDSLTVDKKETAKEPSKTPKYVGKVVAEKLNVRTGAGTQFSNLTAYPYLLNGNLVDVCDEVGDWLYIRIATKHFGYVFKNYIIRQ